MDLSSSRIIMIYKGEIIDYVYEDRIMNFRNDYKFLFDVSELS